MPKYKVIYVIRTHDDAGPSESERHITAADDEAALRRGRAIAADEVKRIRRNGGAAGVTSVRVYKVEERLTGI